MKTYIKSLRLLTFTLCLSLPLHAMSSSEETQVKTSLLNSEQSESTYLNGEISEDNTLFIPLEEQREEFLREENLVLDHRTKQSHTDTGLESIFGLSIDGGGGRGVMSAIWLKNLKTALEENGVKKPLPEIFECIGGTSIGGILALKIASDPDLNFDNLINLFVEHGERIFPKKGRKTVKLKTLGGLIGSKYLPQSLEALLQEQLGLEKTFEEFETKVVVTACTTTGKPKLFKSFDEEDKYLPLWQVGRCTSAAPTYFPAFEIGNNHYVDGGMWINNPSTLVTTTMVKEAHKGSFSPNNLYVLSLGTGDMRLHTTLSFNAGITSVGNIINLLMQSNSQGNHESMQSFLGDNYYRVNCLLDHPIDLAATDRETMEWLTQCAEHGSANRIICDFAKKVADLQRTRE